MWLVILPVLSSSLVWWWLDSVGVSGTLLQISGLIYFPFLFGYGWLGGRLAREVK